MDTESEFLEGYDSEINCSISTFWDEGFNVRRSGGRVQGEIRQSRRMPHSGFQDLSGMVVRSNPQQPRAEAQDCSLQHLGPTCRLGPSIRPRQPPPPEGK